MIAGRSRPLLGITAGDPAGIGPELAGKMILQPPDGVDLLGVGNFTPLSPGVPSIKGAKLAWDAMEEAASLVLAGDIDGVVTGPVCKHTLHQAGFPYPGQTEFFAHRAGVENFAMILTGRGLTVGLVSIHISLRQAVDRLTSEEIFRVGMLLAGFCRHHLRDMPRIAVAGLNPHAGEDGEFGSEEKEIVSPAVVRLAATRSAHFVGPISPDTVFYRAVQGEFDAVLCLYHDQGLIPLKLHAFSCGVNVTWGLPFLRTSPDHGTAFDLAGKGIADPSSFRAAVELAASLVPLR